MPHLNNTASCHFRVSMHQYNYSNIFESIRGSPSPTGRAHARHPRTAFSSLFPMKNYSCPLVSIRGSYSFRHFVPFVPFVVSWLNTPSAPSWLIRVHSCSFVVHTPSPSFRVFRAFRAFRGSNVFFSVHSCSFVVHILSAPSWFISFRPFVVHILSIPSCPFVASKDHCAIKKQTCHPRKIIKKVYISTCYSKT